ncbi:acyl-CoA dehydrogenase family protein [Polaromonas sp. P1-6]|nr:acyl-CoA dehydrogenase family protein [Polaromonas sp. P1-6]
MLLAAQGEQIERWLTPAVRGERVCSIAITEAGAGSDAAGISTRAVKTPEGWRLSGSKHFISDGEVSDFFVVSALTGNVGGKRKSPCSWWTRACRVSRSAKTRK